MTMARPQRILTTMTLVVLGVTTQALAQTNDEIFPQFQWNFSTPGARANAMGRAFIGVADDATATVTNPSGLMSLAKPQVYVEYKNTDLKVNRLARVDSLFTLQPTAFPTNINTFSFLAISSPIGSRVAAGFTVHEFLNYQETFDLAPRPVPNVPNVFFPVHGSADFNARSYAGTIAVSLNDRIQLGVTVSANQLRAQSRSDRLGTIAGPAYVYPTSRYDLSESSIVVSQTAIEGTQTAAAFSIGAFFRPNDKVSVGVDYSKAPKFHITETLKENLGYTASPCCGTNQPLTTVAGFPKDVSIDVPDRFGVGVAVRPSPRVLIALDAVRINYSSLAENFTVVFDVNTLTGTDFSIDDVTEVHVGGEFNVATGRNPVFVRAGMFTNPDHALRFLGVSNAVVNATNSAKYNLLARDGEMKGTLGAGFVVGSSFQADVAYIWKAEVVASAAVRF